MKDDRFVMDCLKSFNSDARDLDWKLRSWWKAMTYISSIYFIVFGYYLTLESIGGQPFLTCWRLVE